jgi:hypothetical protein
MCSPQSEGHTRKTKSAVSVLKLSIVGYARSIMGVKK